MYDYEKDPQEIYRKSFATIRAEADLARFDDDEQSIVIRLIHASGMIDLAADIVLSPGAVKAGMDALAKGANIICDVEMVRKGIIRTGLNASSALLCEIGGANATHHAVDLRTTRSAGGIEALVPHIPGSVIVIGNAPTALFHLLELLHGGLAKPALIVGCPVGFVGAVESKAALMEFEGVEFITVRGRRGGSAIAAAAVNALAALSRNGIKNCNSGDLDGRANSGTSGANNRLVGKE